MDNLPVNTAKIQRGKPFEKGQSGNPNGKPKGARNKTTLAIQELLDGEAETITRKAIELAKDGDIAALRLCLERILPPRKDAPINITLPTLQKTDDIPEVMNTLLTAVAAGELTPLEGQALTGMLEQYRKSIETDQLARKLDSLQAILQSRK